MTIASSITTAQKLRKSAEAANAPDFGIPRGFQGRGKAIPEMQEAVRAPIYPIPLNQSQNESTEAARLFLASGLRGVVCDFLYLGWLALRSLRAR